MNGISITATVMRKWERKPKKPETDAQQSSLKGLIYGVEMILVYRSGATIQASINKKLLKSFNSGFKEGKVYSISKFSTSSNVANEKATSYKCKVWFEYNTKVMAMHPNTNIPDCVYNFCNFEDIIHAYVQPNFYFGRNNYHAPFSTNSYLT